MATSGRPPLHGIRVVDFSRVIAGPMCTQILSDMGAEVIKIENPDGGDDTRKGAGPRRGGESHFFMTFNRGKKSVALDFTKPEGQARGEEAARIGRRAGPELPARRAQQVRPRLQEPSREASAADLSVDLGLRPDRAVVGPAGLRSGAAGRIGHDERERRGQRRGPAPCHRHRRHHDGHPFGGGDQRRAVRPPPHRQGPAHRSRALRHRARLAGQHGLLLPDRRRAAAGAPATAISPRRPTARSRPATARSTWRWPTRSCSPTPARRSAIPNGRPIRASPPWPTASPTSPS